MTSDGQTPILIQGISKHLILAVYPDTFDTILDERCMNTLKPAVLRRCWLFLAGADKDALFRAPGSGADVLIQDLEDFTPPDLLDEARRLSPGVLAAWRAGGIITAVRINPLDKGGLDDLDVALSSGAQVILLPKTNTPKQIVRLERAIADHESRLRIPAGTTEIVPNLEFALGLVNAYAICKASSRITAALVAAEDIANDLGAERSQEMSELDHVRGRFHVDCTAAGVVSIDMPYTWSDPAGAEHHARSARRIGFVAKSAVDARHVSRINAVFTPDRKEIARARKIVKVFEAARSRGEGRVEIDGMQIEVPIYLNAGKILERARALGVI